MVISYHLSYLKLLSEFAFNKEKQYRQLGTNENPVSLMVDKDQEKQHPEKLTLPLVSAKSR